MEEEKRCAEQYQRPHRRGSTIIVKDGGLTERQNSRVREAVGNRDDHSFLKGQTDEKLNFDG